MGRLSGFRYRELIRRLKKFGFEFDRTAKGTTKSGLTLFPAFIQPFQTIPATFRKEQYRTVHAILKQADISPDEFLKQ